jgi:hypothetical protein
MDKLNTRNVFEMMDYRADAGFSAMAQIEAYWEALRGSRLMPKRSEIDPRGIETALEYTFVLERIAIGMARLRIAGSHLNNLMGMEVRGMPLTSFITPNGRAQMGDILEEVFQRPSACEIRLSTEVGRDKPAMDARMLLLPLKSDLGDVSRVLGCFIARGEMGNQSRRFDIISTKTRPLVLSSADGGASLAGQKPKPRETVSGFHDQKVDYSGQSKPNEKPYLRLIKNDG